MKRGWLELVCALILVACSGPARQPSTDLIQLSSANKDLDSNVGVDPLPVAPPLLSDRVFVQSLGDDSRRAWVTGLPGAAVEGVTEVCALNTKSGAQACFQTTETPDGVSFSGTLPDSNPKDIVKLWALPGGPDINSIDEPVLRFTSRFPATVRSFAEVRSAIPEHDGLYIGEAGTGLYFLPRSDFNKSPEEASFRGLTVRDGLPTDDVGAIEPDGGDGIWFIGVGAGLFHLTYSGEAPEIASYSGRDGFPTTINNILSDQNGGYWLTSQSGLHHFTIVDGLPRLVVCDSVPAPVFGIALDETGNVWAGTTTGVSHAVWTGDRIEAENYAINDGRRRPGFYNVASDGAGGVFAAGFHLGYEHLTFPGGALHIDHYDEIQSGEVINFLRPDGSGGLWMSTMMSGLVHVTFEGVLPNYQAHFGFRSSDIGVTFPSSDGGMWVGTREDGFAKAIVSTDGEQVQNYWETEGLQSNYVSSIFVGSSGIWIGGRGLSRLTFQGNQPKYENFYPTENPASFPLPRASSIVADRTGGMWVGSATYDGLVHVSFGGDGLPHFKKYSTADGLSSNYVSSIALDDGDGVWLAQWNVLTHLTLGAGGTPKIVTYTNDPKDPASLPTSVNKVAVDEEGGVWIAACDYYCPDGFPRLARLTFNNGVPHFRAFGPAEGLNSDVVYDVIAAAEGNGVWLATEKGITKAKIESDQPVFIDYFGENMGENLALDRSGGIWGTGRSGLTHLRFDELGTPTYRHLNDFPYIGVSLATDPRGGVWVGTRLNGFFFISE